MSSYRLIAWIRPLDHLYSHHPNQPNYPGGWAANFPRRIPRGGERGPAQRKLPTGNPAGGGAIITFQFRDGRISAVLQQPLPGALTPATPIKITAEIREMVKNAQVDGFPMTVAHVDTSGQPIISFRGSTQVFSDTQLAIWVRNSDGNFLGSVKANPKLALMYRNGKTRALYQFQGRAHISTDEAAREQIFSNMNQSERNHDYARTGIALIIDLDRIEGWAGMSPDGQVGKVRMLREAS